MFHLAYTEDLRPSLDDRHVAALDYRAEHRLNKSSVADREAQTNLVVCCWPRIHSGTQIPLLTGTHQGRWRVLRNARKLRKSEISAC